MNGKNLPAILAVVCIMLSGCTSIQVKRADPATGMRHLCIQDNPRVTVPGFVEVLRDGIERNGLSSEMYEGQKPAHCEFILTYTALRSWDLGTYLSHAELRIERNGRQLASAQYHLRGKGGFSLTKWQGVETKMNPVIDELFADYRNGASNGAATVAALPAGPVRAPADTAAPAPVVDDRAERLAAAREPGAAASAAAPEDGFSYAGDPASAAKAMAQARNCATGFQLLGNEVGRSLYAASCWGNKKLVIICEQGRCREAR